MNRRNFLGAAALTAGSAAVASAAARPNIVLLHSHDLGRYLHCYGVRTVQTPNFDRLAAEGVLFERSFCTAPQCSPSRASIFTGRYPHNNGVMGLCHADFAWDLNPGERHLGQLLKAAGYRTIGVGVLHETHSGPERCGFDEFLGAGARAKSVADATIAKLKELARAPGKPFYFQAGTVEPHRMKAGETDADVGFLGANLTPDSSLGVEVPPYLRDTPGTRQELAELQGSIRHLDSQVGRILDALRESGLEKNTLFIYTTDHGIAMPRAKCSVYEPGLQTALLLRLPGRGGWSGGIRHRAMISNIDYLPTILDAVGLPTPAQVQGRSFAPLLDGKPYTARDAIFGELTYHEHYDPRRSVRTETHKLIVNFSSAHAFMDPSQSWRPRSDTVVPPNNASAYHPPFELYDLSRDPWEQHDVSKDPRYQTALGDLRARLRKHMEETADPLLAGPIPCPLHRRSTAWLLG